MKWFSLSKGLTNNMVFCYTSEEMRLRSGITTVYVDAKEVRRTRDRTRLSFPSLVAGVRSMSKEAIRQFRELLLIEWSTEVFHFAPEFSDFLRMARLRKESEAARLVNQIVNEAACLFNRIVPRNTTDLVMIDHELGQQFKDLYSKKFTSVGLVLAGVWSDQTDLQLLATKKFRILLLDCASPVDPPFILEYGIIPRFEEFLDRKDSPDLQTEAALALIDISSIALLYTDLLINHGLVKILLNLLDSPSSDVREKAVLQLGMVAETSTGRDLVHRHDAVRPLVDKVLRPSLDENAKLDKLNENDKLLPTLRNATYALLRFCKGEEKRGLFEEKVTENKYGKLTVVTPVGLMSKGPHLDKVRTALPELFRLVSLTDEEVLPNACSVLARLTDSTYCKTRVIIGDCVCRRLVELLEHQSPSVVSPALRTLGNIVLRDDIQSECIVDFGALPCLWKLLSKSVEEREVWRIIRSLTKVNNRRIKAAQIDSANSQFPEYEEVKEKLDKYAKRELLIFCGDLGIPVCHFTARKEDIVPKLMDYLEGRHATTVELLAEKEQSSKGKKRRRESTKNPSSASVSSKGSTKSRKKTETASQKDEKKNVHESEDESEQEEDADEEEPEKETANDVPAEQMSDQGESDEENESEDKLSPSDDELCAAIGEILREVDIHTITYTAIVERLSKRFGTDLTPRKSHIMIMVGFQLIELSDEDEE